MKGQTNKALGHGLYMTTRPSPQGQYRYLAFRWFEDGRQRERGLGNAERGLGNAERVSVDEARRMIRGLRQEIEHVR